jgi:signal transduction histidine kinase
VIARGHTLRRLRDRRRSDATLAAVAVAAAVFEVLVDGDAGRWGCWLLALTPVAVAGWHRAPAASALWLFGLLSVARAGDAPVMEQYVPFAVTILTAFMAGSWVRRNAWWVFAAVAAGPFVNGAGLDHGGIQDAPFLLLMAAVPFFAGRAVRRRRMVRAQLELRALELEHQREENARLAVAQERARIARDLHDVVAASLSVMTVQAGGARRVVDRNPEAAREALQAIADSGRTSLAELDRLLGVIEDRPAELGLTAVGRLVEDARQGGVDAALVMSGDPRRLPPEVDLSAYRIVQEALTNVVKHAAGATAQVIVAGGPTGVVVEIADDGGTGAQDRHSGDGGGHGLRGMRERAELFGGTVEAGPYGSGWRVRAQLPA